jgi:hypothetical protein
MHSGGGKKHRRIVVGQQGLTLNPGMAFGSKKFDIFGTKFVSCHGFIIYGESFPPQDVEGDRNLTVGKGVRGQTPLPCQEQQSLKKKLRGIILIREYPVGL